jgi:hypothetical protein
VGLPVVVLLVVLPCSRACGPTSRLRLIFVGLSCWCAGTCVLQVFPRPKLDAALEARRLEREEATRQAKANLSKRAKTGFALRVPSSGQLAASGGESWTCIGP